MPSSYKLIVPEDVEAKIRYLIRKFPHNEWSGILFYSHTGSFEDNNLVITCMDIFPMADGSSGWTEFNMNADVAGYMAEHIELFDCELGLVHSHHTMGAFFSSQDIHTLNDQGNDKNCFVSLIVDTRGTYVAAITRKVTTKNEITTEETEKSYVFFGDGVKQLPCDSNKVTEHKENIVIEYYMLNVERHEVPNPYSYLDTRFEEIQANHVNTNTSTSFLGTSQISAHLVKQQSLFDENVSQNHESTSNKLNTNNSNTLKSTLQNNSLTNYDLTEYIQIDDAAIHKAVARILCCSLIINPDKVKLSQWVDKYMIQLYKKLFNTNDNFGVSASFESYASWIIEWTITNFLDVEVDSSIVDSPDIETYVCSEIASKIEELLISLGDNVYIQYYCSLLDTYIQI